MTEPKDDLCEYELTVLRSCNGEDSPDLCWGAAMGQALEVLTRRGLIITVCGVCELTQAGLDRLAAR
jgi:hypothetical protein